MKNRKIQKRAQKKKRAEEPARQGKQRPAPAMDDESITSRSLSEQRSGDEAEPQLVDAETLDEKRLRIAKSMIEETRKALADDPELAPDHDATADFFLKQAAARDRKLAYATMDAILSNFRQRQAAFEETALKGHLKTITACALSQAGDVYTVSKDGAILVFRKQEGFRRAVFSAGAPKDRQGHVGEVYAVDVSLDDRYLVTGGSDRAVRVWNLNAASDRLHCELKGHKADVHGVAFRPNSTECVSVSGDRTLKVWEYQQKGLIQTMHGHSAEVLDVCMLGENVGVSVGYDRLPILWKFDKETQTVYAPQLSSLDCVAAVDARRFVTGSEGGEVCLWSVAKRKPICRLASAHAGGWVSAVAAHFNGDVFATGASDNRICFYRLKKESFSKEFEIASQGIVNHMKFSADGRTLLVVEGQDNRVGRWTPKVQAKSRIRLIKLF